MLTPQMLHEQRWQDLPQRERPSARSILLTLLGEYVRPRDEAVWTQTFLAAFEHLGYAEATARQALSRSCAAGWLDAERVGRMTRWRLSPRMHSTVRDGAARIYTFRLEPPPNEGEWLLLQITVPEVRRRLREQLRTRLTWAGFGSAGQGLWICPHLQREDEARAILEELGLLGRAASFRAATGSIGDMQRLVERAWSLEHLVEGYERFLDEWRRCRPRGDAACFVAVTRLVHQWRAFPFADPQLPSHLFAHAGTGQRAARRFRELYDRWSAIAQSWWNRTADTVAGC